MASINNVNVEVDLEKGQVEHEIEVFKIDEGKGEPIIAEHNDAAIALQKFPVYTAIISFFFIFAVTWGFMISDHKEKTQTAFTLFLVAIIVSILVGMVSTFGRALHRRRMGRALPMKRVMVMGYVLLCTSEGFFMVSVFAAVYTLVPFQLFWDAFYVGLAILLVQVAFLALLYAVFELRPGFVGMAVLTCLAIAFRVTGLFVVAHFALATPP